MGNEQDKGGVRPPLRFGNIFIGCKELWEKIPPAMQEQCQWHEYEPSSFDEVSLILLDSGHPDGVGLIARSHVPVIVLCCYKTPQLVEQFTAAGAIDILCAESQAEQIVSTLRVVRRLNGRFNHIIQEAEQKQTKTLLQTAQSLGVPYDVNELLVQIADSIMDVVDAVNVCIVRIDTDNECVLDVLTNSTWGVDPPIFTYRELQDGLSGYVLQAKKTIISSWLKPDEREKPYIQEKRSRVRVGSLIVAPIMYDDTMIGTFTVSRDHGQPDFMQNEVDIVATMVQMGAVAIKNAQLSQNVHHALDQTRILLNVAEALISSDNPAALLERVLKEVIDGLDAMGGMYIHYDVDEEMIISSERFVKHDNMIVADSIDDYTFFMRGLSGHTIRNKTPILSTEQNDRRQSDEVYQYRVATKTGSILVAPIINGDIVLGTISVHRSMGQVNFTQSDLEILTAVANQIASALIHVRSYEDTKLRVDILAKRLEQRNHDLEIINNELRKANKQLQQVDKLKDKFVNEVSHELRKPVTAFRLYLSLLEKRPENWDRYLDTLNDEADKFEELITAILDLARLHVVDTQVQGETVDFADLIQTRVDWMRPKVEEKGLLFKEQLIVLPSIKGIANLLSQMIKHLINNALLYTDQGCILVSSGYGKGVVWFQIEDSGIGVPEEEVPLLHHRFYRGKQVEQERPGIGLGLSFAHEITKLHGGTLNIVSNIGQGSTVRVALPLHSQGIQSSLSTPR